MAAYLSKRKNQGNKAWYEITADRREDLTQAAKMYRAYIVKAGKTSLVRISEYRRGLNKWREVSLPPGDPARWKRLNLPR